MISKLIDNIKKNYESFHAELLNSSVEEVYTRATQIHYYENIHSYLMIHLPQCKFTKEQTDFLLSKGGNILDFLYGTDCDLSMFETVRGFSSMLDNEMAKELTEADYSSLLKMYSQDSFEQYKTSELQKSKEEIFDNSYETLFYISMNDYLQDHALSEEICQYLCNDGDNVLIYLYNDYKENEYARIDTYLEIEEFINNCYEKNSASNQEQKEM